MRIIALDPGGTTGVHVWDDLSGKSEIEQLGPEKHHLELHQLLDWHHRQEIFNHAKRGLLIIICERYDNRNKFAVPISREYIGVVELFVQQATEGTVMLVMQAASDIKPPKGWATNEKLKVLKLLPRGHTTEALKHAVDGTRHFVYFVCHHKSMQDSKLRADMMAVLKELVQS